MEEIHIRIQQRHVGLFRGAEDDYWSMTSQGEKEKKQMAFFSVHESPQSNKKELQQLTRVRHCTQLVHDYVIV